MSEQKPYIPIDCSMHDELLALATRRKECTITYLDDETRTTTLHSIIEDVYTSGTEELLRTKGGPVIRLDRLIRVDDKLIVRSSND